MTGNLLTIGLPEAGKTTYLAAFYHVIYSNELDADWSIQIDEKDRSYLNKILEEWHAAGATKRTNFEDGVRNVDMTIVSKSGSDRFDLVWPDVSGELFRNMWERRSCTPEYQNMVEGAAGVMLFVHAGRVKKGHSIGDASRALQDVDKLLAHVGAGKTGPTEQSRLLTSMSNEAQIGDVPESGDGGVVGGAEGEGDVETNVDVRSGSKLAEANKDEKELPSWKRKDASMQVQLVEILQDVVRLRVERSQLPLCVVVSAWDVVEEEGLSPGGWMERNLPLLHQYIVSKGFTDTFKIVGVRALGGHPNRGQSDRQRMPVQSKRIKVVDPKEESAEGGVPQHDITLPVKWLLAQATL